MPITPSGNSSSSDMRAASRPYTWAMPSPTSTTVPTLRVSVVSSNDSILLLMMLMISSDRMAIASPCGRSQAPARAGTTRPAARAGG